MPSYRPRSSASLTFHLQSRYLIVKSLNRDRGTAVSIQLFPVDRRFFLPLLPSFNFQPLVPALTQLTQCCLIIETVPTDMLNNSAVCVTCIWPIWSSVYPRRPSPVTLCALYIYFVWLSLCIIYWGSTVVPHRKKVLVWIPDWAFSCVEFLYSACACMCHSGNSGLLPQS